MHFQNITENLERKNENHTQSKFARAPVTNKFIHVIKQERNAYNINDIEERNGLNGPQYSS
jgi:hypothetical protein